MVGGQVKILVAPLDWGLGHATRCVPVIKEFLARGAEVELATVKANSAFFRDVFPELRQRIAPGYNVVYPNHSFNMAFWLLKNSAHLKAVMRYERRYAEEMVERHGYDILFSDNRFGFYSKKAYNVYMTHQLRIAFPPAFSSFEGIGVKWHAMQMKNFDEVWVPDLEAFPGYAGRLSHVDEGGLPVKFVGPLSRFEMVAAGEGTAQKDFDIVAVVSGVEPARTRFEDRLRRILPQIPGRHVVLLGKPSVSYDHKVEGNVEYHTHLPTSEFADIVRRSKYVLSRGGYSTIMDMAVLGAKCIFVPTPGQYEQGALVRELSDAGYAVAISENELSVESLRAAVGTETAMLPATGKDLLQTAVVSLFEKVVR